MRFRYLLLLTALAFISCQRIELPGFYDNIPPKPYLMGALRPNFPAKIDVGYALNLGNTQNLDSIKDARIKMFVNGAFQEEIVFREITDVLLNRTIKGYISAYVLQPNDFIRIEVILSDGTILSAEEQVLPLFTLENVDSLKSLDRITYKIRFPNSGFYRIGNPSYTAFESGQATMFLYDSAHFYDKSIRENSPYALIPFNDYIYTLNFDPKILSPTLPAIMSRVTWYSRNAELFIRDEAKNFQSDRGLFGNFTTTHSNVTNGIGILYSETSFDVMMYMK